MGRSCSLSNRCVSLANECYLPLSPRTAAPIIGGSAADGIFIAAGHAVWGINNSLGTGKVLVELMLDGKAHSADIRQLQP